MRISEPREKYVESVFGLQDPELEPVLAAMESRGNSYMSINSSEARILQFLIRGFGIRSVVEIGTLYGYSSLCMAKALPGGGRLITLEKNPENHAVATEMFARSTAGRRIEALCGDAAALLARLTGPFDMVFIDANKSGYTTYLDWAEKHVRPGGLIVGDNTFLFGAMYGPSDDREAGPAQIQAMSEFNRRLADPAKYNSIIVPTREGLTVAQKL